MIESKASGVSMVIDPSIMLSITEVDMIVGSNKFLAHESHQKHLICNIGHFEEKLYKISPKTQKLIVVESTNWNSTNKL